MLSVLRAQQPTEVHIRLQASVTEPTLTPDFARKPQFADQGDKYDLSRIRVAGNRNDCVERQAKFGGQSNE